MRKWRGGTALLLTAAVILSTAAGPFFGTSVFAAETLDAIIVVDEDAENTEDNAGGGAETLTTSTVSGNEIKEIPVTAKVTFRGIGDYGGFRTVSFKITARAAR